MHRAELVEAVLPRPPGRRSACARPGALLRGHVTPGRRPYGVRRPSARPDAPALPERCIGTTAGRGIGTALGRGRRDGGRARVARHRARLCSRRDLVQAWEVGSSPLLSVRGGLELPSTNLHPDTSEGENPPDRRGSTCRPTRLAHLSASRHLGCGIAPGIRAANRRPRPRRALRHVSAARLRRGGSTPRGECRAIHLTESSRISNNALR